MKIGKLHCPPVPPLWDTFVSGHRPPTINFTYLPLSRLSPALKLKISSIVIALRATLNSIAFIKCFRKYSIIKITSYPFIERLFNSLLKVIINRLNHPDLIFNRSFNNSYQFFSTITSKKTNALLILIDLFKIKLELITLFLFENSVEFL